MDRAEEFRMARRYEFLKARLQDAEGRSDRDYEAQCRREFEALRNLFVERSLHLVFNKVHRYRGLGVDVVDLIQESNASLFQAIDGFDWRRDVRFNTYAQYWIHQAILKNLYDASRTVRLPVWIQKAYRKIQKLREAERDLRGDWPPNEIVAEKLDMPVERVEEILAARRYAVSLDRPAFSDADTTIGQTVPDDAIAPIEERITEGDLGETLHEALGELPPRLRSILERRFGVGQDQPETLASIAEDLGVTAERVRQLQNAALERLRKPHVRKSLEAFD